MLVNSSNKFSNNSTMVHEIFIQRQVAYLRLAQCFLYRNKILFFACHLPHLFYIKHFRSYLRAINKNISY